MAILRKLLGLAALFAVHTAFCQNSYSLKWYSADSNHLPQNSVKSIVPDKYGYIWLSTESGLVRYDGESFKIFNSENLPGLTADRLFAFTGSVGRDSITIRNEIDELIVISKRNAKVFHKPVLPYPVPVKKPFKRPFKETVIASYFAGKFDFFNLSHDNGYYLIGNDSIRSYNAKNRLLHAFSYDYKEGAQFFILSGNLYILGDNSDYIKFDEENPIHNKFMRPFKGKYEVYTNVTAQQVFIYAENKLFYVKENRGRLITYCVFEDFGLHQYNTGSLYFDEKNEILYLGSLSKGLLIARKQPFRYTTASFKHANGTNGVYYALTGYNPSQILASTGDIIDANGNIGNIDIGKFSDKYMLVKDAKGDIWTKNDNTVYRIKKSSGYKDYESWNFAHRVNTVMKAGDRIWVANINDSKRNGELYYIDTKTNKLNFFLKLDFSPTCLYASPDEKVLWGGSRFGLHKIDIKNKTITRVKQLKDHNIRSIYIKNPSEVWATSYNRGLLLYKDDKVTVFPPDKNQYMLTSHCMVEDNKGFFWITTNKGLFQVKKSDLFAYADKKADKVFYYYYDKSEGFSNNEFNGGCNPCGVYLNNKTIFFPSIEGVVNFNPEYTKPIEPAGGIYIDRAVADTTSYTDLNNLAFKRNFGRLTFYISSPYFGNLYNQDIEAKLDGEVTQDWASVKDGNISFSTLPPGDYTLTVRKLRGFGSGMITETLDFSIMPAFWQTSWFTFILGIFGGLMLIVIIKLRIRYIRYKNILLEKEVALQTSQLHNTIRTLRKTQEDLSRQNANHKKLIKTITHDIKSPLKFMAITGKYVYNNLESDNNTGLKAEIESIYTSSAQLYHFVDEFLEYTKDADNNSESEPYVLATLVNEKINFFMNIAQSKRIQLYNHISKKISIRLNKHLISIIVHNLLDNAIKNTEAGEIHFMAYMEDSTLFIKIKDTGAGMTEELIKYYKDILKNKGNVKQLVAGGGMGMQMVLELLIIMGGDMEIEATKNKGTEFTLSFKV